MQVHLLIADAFGSVTERIKQYFTRRGYQVDVVNDALECLARMQHRHPDALILDEDLPFGGGDGVLAWMRGDSRSSDIPVVLMTERNVQPNDGCPVTYRLQRPFRVDDLFDAVNRVLKPAVQASAGMSSCQSQSMAE